MVNPHNRVLVPIIYICIYIYIPYRQHSPGEIVVDAMELFDESRIEIFGLDSTQIEQRFVFNNPGWWVILMVVQACIVIGICTW